MNLINTEYQTPKQKRTDRERTLFLVPLRDLEAQTECYQMLRLEHRDDTTAGGNLEVLNIMIEENERELKRRYGILEQAASDPNFPTFEDKAIAMELRVRIVKECFPIYRFCEEVLGARLMKSTRSRYKACCPLPGHDDSSPSFVVYEATESAWCFGCNRGGDILELVGIMFDQDRFFDRLEHLERLAGIEIPARKQTTPARVSSIRPPVKERRFVNGQWVA